MPKSSMDVLKAVGVEREALPRHVAIIMDGNGRWAKRRGLPRIRGHEAGAQAVRRVVTECARLELEALTLYSFSTENWKRPKEEVDYLMDLLREFIDEKLKEFVESGVRLRVAGEIDSLPESLRETVTRAIVETEGGKNLDLTVALSYGGRQELTRVCREIAADAAGGRLGKGEISEETIRSRLYTAEVPDPDLIIRTSGELRLSNFLLWQAAYAELYFTEVLWPDFTPAELIYAIASYQGRKRRFGGLKGDEGR